MDIAALVHQKRHICDTEVNDPKAIPGPTVLQAGACSCISVA
jgi:hypothetical protein